MNEFGSAQNGSRCRDTIHHGPMEPFWAWFPTELFLSCEPTPQLWLEFFVVGPSPDRRAAVLNAFLDSLGPTAEVARQEGAVVVHVPAQRTACVISLVSSLPVDRPFADGRRSGLQCPLPCKGLCALAKQFGVSRFSTRETPAGGKSNSSWLVVHADTPDTLSRARRAPRDMYISSGLLCCVRRHVCFRVVPARVDEDMVVLSALSLENLFAAALQLDCFLPPVCLLQDGCAGLRIPPAASAWLKGVLFLQGGVLDFVMTAHHRESRAPCAIFKPVRASGCGRQQSFAAEQDAQANSRPSRFEVT